MVPLHGHRVLTQHVTTINEKKDTNLKKTRRFVREVWEGRMERKT